MAIPVAKISETLLAFAELLLGSAPESLTWEEVEGALKLAWTVWNAAVMDATRKNRSSSRRCGNSSPRTTPSHKWSRD